MPPNTLLTVPSYEVQLVESARRLGLGNFLVHELISVAKKWKMDKVMLTCLKGGF